MLNMYGGFKPKFVKHFANIGEEMKKAFKQYDQEVKDVVFPEEQHTFKIDDDILEKLY